MAACRLRPEGAGGGGGASTEGRKDSGENLKKEGGEHLASLSLCRCFVCKLNLETFNSFNRYVCCILYQLCKIALSSTVNCSLI